MPVRTRPAVLVLALLAAGAPAPAGAQERVLVVRRGGDEVGRETFGVRPGRDRGSDGSTLAVESRYPGDRTRVAATLQRDAAGALSLFKLRVDTPEGPSTILAAGAGARLVVRTEALGSETGREVPGGRDVVLLDDHALALWAAVAEAATPAGVRLTALWPRTNRRGTLTARRDGNRVTVSGEVAGTLVLGADGQLERLDFPALGLQAVRQ